MWAAAAALSLLYFGPALVGVLRPAPDEYSDFVQEWLSARSYRSGDPVYLPQRDAMLLHTGRDVPAFASGLPWNAHPPVAVLVALPFGAVPDYRAAHLAWNLLTFPLLVLSVVLVAREWGFRFRWWSVFAAVPLVVSCQPVLAHLYQGQLNFVILLLLVAAWIADRRGHQVAAGVAVGTAAALKIFPGLLLVYFVATRRWRAAAAAVATGLALNAVAFAVLGAGAFETYVRDVLPSLKMFRGTWSNVSLTGYWTRVGSSLGAPALGLVAAACCQLAAVAAVWLVARRAATGDDRDRAFALAVAAMPLASPVAWAHYFVILLLPVALLLARLPRGAAFCVLIAVCAVLWLPESFYPGLLIGRSAAAAMPVVGPLPGGVGMAVVGLGPFTYALVALFLLVCFARFAPAGAGPLTSSDSSR
jgi:hypothetical protein